MLGASDSRLATGLAKADRDLGMVGAGMPTLLSLGREAGRRAAIVGERKYQAASTIRINKARLIT